LLPSMVLRLVSEAKTLEEVEERTAGPRGRLHPGV
jgi:hypothetical protein